MFHVEQIEMSAKPKPKTEAEWCAYRAQASCRIGREVLDGESSPPPNVTRMECAMFNLLHAVEELAKLIEVKK